MCALAGYHPYASAFVWSGIETSDKGPGGAHYCSATWMTRIDEPTPRSCSYWQTWSTATSYCCARVTYACAQAWLCTLHCQHCSRSIKSAAALCCISKTDRPRSRNTFTFFFLFFLVDWWNLSSDQSNLACDRSCIWSLSDAYNLDWYNMGQFMIKQGFGEKNWMFCFSFKLIAQRLAIILNEKQNILFFFTEALFYRKLAQIMMIIAWLKRLAVCLTFQARTGPFP